MGRLLIKNARALLGTHPAGTTRVSGTDMGLLPTLEDAWLLAENGRITALGPMAEWPGVQDWNGLTVVDATGRLVLPGWCDPHTHTVFAAPREEEFVMKIRGATYQEIAGKGGGILNSARRLREMSEDDLYVRSRARLEEMMQQGTVAVEIKSGYGLSLEGELKMLRVAARLKADLPLQVRCSLLAAHALPESHREDRSGYLRMIVQELMPAVVAEGLAQYVDVFCESGYFTVAEMEQLLEAGARHGLPGKVHVNQFNSLGGVAAAVRHGARSVDHLEVMTGADLDALAGSTTIPTLLPACSFFLRIPYAPARDLIERGCAVALASDHNPGSAPSGNMNLVLSLACIQLRMLPEEAIHAATLNAAAAMDLGHELGSLAPGRRASMIITRPVPSPAFLPYAFGSDLIDTVIIDGTIVRAGTATA